MTKLITAVIKPEKLDEVIRAVERAGARGLTATEVMGFGRQYGHLGVATPPDESALVLPKVRIDVLTRDEMVEPIVDAIATAVNTHSAGDGKIWVCAIETALRVRTGERNEAAV